jgi:acetyltransferase-like isoleucine patch superfamily enzyme
MKHKIKDLFCSNDKKRIKIAGKNNTVYVADLRRSSKIKLHIYGDDNQIIVNTKKRFIADIFIGSENNHCRGCKIIIGEDATSEGIVIRMQEDNLNLQIGADCMFSDDIQIFCSDIHTIVNAENEIINHGNKLVICNHVWIGNGVYIAKNSYIADNCIVGMKSVVAGKFEESNCVIAGNPAHIVKHNVNWDRLPIPRFEATKGDIDENS